jgi:hypothetical protein
MSQALRPSWAKPSVRFKVIGRFSASISAWILLVSSPRERPCNRISQHFFALGGVLMHADRRGVDHLDITIVSL